MSNLFLTIIGWVHALAAVTWVGGGIFYWVVLRPAIKSGELPESVSRFAAVEFGQLVVLSMWTLVVTGGVLMFSRLSQPTATLPYVVVLGIKVALSAWMFFLALNRRGRRPTATQSGRLRTAVNALGHINMTVVLGIIVFLLSDVLRWLVVRQLAS